MLIDKLAKTNWAILIFLLLLIFAIGGGIYYYLQSRSLAPEEDQTTPTQSVVGCGDGICNNGERFADCPADCDKYFTNFNLKSSEFDELMADIGVERFPTREKDEILRRTQEILRWLAAHRAGEKEQQECFNYVEKIKDYDGWESPETLGKVYKKYGYICPGTCFSTAYTFSVLVYKSGISEEDFQMIGRNITKNNEYQHWWTRVKMGEDKWLWIDPLCAEENTVLSEGKNLLCNKEIIYHPCRYVTPQEYGDINKSSWHCLE
jgi:hypothetical protein